jgi:hypothetical protein
MSPNSEARSRRVDHREVSQAIHSNPPTKFQSVTTVVINLTDGSKFGFVALECPRK